jgi:hypothetical protein
MMRDLVILVVHVIAVVARLLGPGGIRSVIAESVLVKQQLLILNRARQRSPNLHASDRLVAGLCALLIHPARLVRSAIIVKPSTLLNLHKAGGAHGLLNRLPWLSTSEKTLPSYCLAALTQPGSPSTKRSLFEFMIR